VILPHVTGISERVRRVRNELAPAERRVVEALLDDYPLAGLGSVGDLATAAGVSAPTVLRLVAKLGFGGYPEFREHVRGEVAARLFSPVEAYPRAEEHGGDLLATAERRYAEAVHATFRGLDPGEVERAVAALCDLGTTVLVAGGRFSGVLATHLAAYLQILRPGVDEVPPEPGRRARALLSVDAATVLVVLDFRRHQPDTVEFGRNAQARGARVVLVCDPLLSPLAPDADVLLTASDSGPPPFDSAAGGLMVVETLIGAVAERLGTSARERLTDFELHANGADPASVRPPAVARDLA
jgi:DNA-binding MurR/RpiR family transcriptional regulator